MGAPGRLPAAAQSAQVTGHRAALPGFCMFSLIEKKERSKSSERPFLIYQVRFLFCRRVRTGSLRS